MENLRAIWQADLLLTTADMKLVDGWHVAGRLRPWQSELEIVRKVAPVGHSTTFGAFCADGIVRHQCGEFLRPPGVGGGQ